MPSPASRTFSPRARDLTRDWYVVDADGQVLGRLAAQVARVLRGKHKPIYAPHVDTGDYVIVVNADKIVLTGRKLDQKNYYRHSGYTGGLKTTVARKMLAAKPEFMIYEAVRGMLPKNKLGRAMIKKLRVFRGAEHTHQAQKPEVLEV